MNRPKVVNLEIRKPNWIQGFTSAEGSFLVNISERQKSGYKFGVNLRFKLTQHERDIQLMESLITYFNCGNVYKNQNVLNYQVEAFSDIENKIIPFFIKYPIIGVKVLKIK